MGFRRIVAAMRVECGFTFLLATRMDVHLPMTATATVNGEPGRQIQRAESAVMNEMHENGPELMITHEAAIGMCRFTPKKHESNYRQVTLS